MASNSSGDASITPTVSRAWPLPFSVDAATEAAKIGIP
jgi:hypothetical protein